MKTNRILILAILFSFSFNALNAQTAAKPSFIVNAPSNEMTFDVQLIKDVQTGKFILAVENPESLEVTITVEGDAGIAYTSHLNSLSFRKRFDLSDKKDGEYTVTINTGRRIYRNSVIITTNESARTLVIK